MIWNDTQLNTRTCLPKNVYYITACTFFIISYHTGSLAITDFNLQDKIIGFVGTVFLVYFGLCNVLMILKGSEYIKKIKKEDDHVTMINIYNKQINFTVSDVLSIETSKFSIIDNFLSGFTKYAPGLNLMLKDGSKYYITSDMENMDTLKAHLLNEVNEEVA